MEDKRSLTPGLNHKVILNEALETVFLATSILWETEINYSNR